LKPPAEDRLGKTGKATCVRTAIACDPPDDPDLRARAEPISAAWGFAPFDSKEHEADQPGSPEPAVLLVVTPSRLEMRALNASPRLVGGRGVFADLTKLDTTSGHGRSFRQPLLRAIGLTREADPRPKVFDATAGLGFDAYHLAAVGCEVTACERHPLLFCLLQDALRRAEATHSHIVERVQPVFADAGGLLHQWADDARKADDNAPANTRPQVIYLDPMFPPAKRAAEKKPMAMARLLAGDDADQDALLDAAKAVATRRVVVKRAAHSPPLAGKTPTAVHKGKSHRFDVYATG